MYQATLHTHASAKDGASKTQHKYIDRRVKVNVQAAQISGNLDRLQGHVMVYDPDTQETLSELSSMRVKQITIVQD